MNWGDTFLWLSDHRIINILFPFSGIGIWKGNDCIDFQSFHLPILSQIPVRNSAGTRTGFNVYTKSAVLMKIPAEDHLSLFPWVYTGVQTFHCPVSPYISVSIWMGLSFKYPQKCYGFIPSRPSLICPTFKELNTEWKISHANPLWCFPLRSRQMVWPSWGDQQVSQSEWAENPVHSNQWFKSPTSLRFDTSSLHFWGIWVFVLAPWQTTGKGSYWWPWIMTLPRQESPWITEQS